MDIISNYLRTDKAGYFKTIDSSLNSQVLYSIVETAKANSLHPFEYIKFVIEELSQNKQTPEKIQEILPWSDKIPAHIRIKHD